MGPDGRADYRHEATGRLDVQITDDAISDLCDAVIALDGYPRRPAGHPEVEDVVLDPARWSTDTEETT